MTVTMFFSFFLFFLFLSVKYSPGKNRVLFIITYFKEIFLYIFFAINEIKCNRRENKEQRFFLKETLNKTGLHEKKLGFMGFFLVKTP